MYSAWCVRLRASMDLFYMVANMVRPIQFATPAAYPCIHVSMWQRDEVLRDDRRRQTVRVPLSVWSKMCATCHCTLLPSCISMCQGRVCVPTVRARIIGCAAASAPTGTACSVWHE